MTNQGNSYIANNINVTQDRYVSGNSRLGNRTLFTNTVDNKRYFSSLDAEIYFGETYIDEVVQITWGIEQSTMPIFGYNSYVFDDIAVGARQISGAFVINFTKSYFMYDVLRSVQGINKNSLYVPDNLNDDSKLTWDSNYSKEHMASWDKCFNIRIGYGDYNTGTSKTMTCLYCVQLTGCQQVIGIDGSPIGETYSFIAKDIRYELESIPEKSVKESSSRSIDEKEANAFNFDIKSLELIRKDTQGKSINSQVVPYTYTFKMEHEVSGGKIKDIRLELKNNSGISINTSSFNLGNSSKIEYQIPYKYSQDIDNQTIRKNTSTVTARLIIGYTMSDKEQTPKFYEEKITIIQE